MAIILKIDKLGDNVESGIISNVSVKAGDTIKSGDVLLEMETDKAVVDITATRSGIVKNVLIKKGATIKPGDSYIELQESDEQQAPDNVKPQPVKETADQEAEPQNFSDSDSATKITSGEKQKDAISVDENSSLADNSVIITSQSSAASSLDSDSAFFNSSALVNASPYVRRFAREIGVDLSQVKGQGTKGRIVIEDVKNYAKMLNERKDPLNMPAATTTESLPDFSMFGAVESVPLNVVKKITAKNMSKLWQIVPMVTQFDKANVTELENFRQANKAIFAKKSAKLTMTAILIKVMSLILKEFPSFNASFDSAKSELIIKKYINIGIAVDTPNGLLVPVIKDVRDKSVLEISLELDQLSKKARERKTKQADLSGGTFTISNLGGIAGTGFTPLVNWPEVAILGVARSSLEPVYDDHSSSFKPALMMPLSLSYDHRVIDGAEAARFLKKVIDVLEKPFQILLIS